jgi:hypothetical protein
MVGPYSPFLPNGRQNNESLVEVRELEFFIKFDCKGGNLIFDVAVLEGDLAGADGSASLFIDWFAARGAYGRVALLPPSGMRILPVSAVLLAPGYSNMPLLVAGR